MSRRDQKGFSLVELMVALTVGLLLLAGVLQILLSSRESFDAQSGSAHLQENLRLGAFVLDHAIAHAGYRPTNAITGNTIFPPVGALDNTPAMGAGSVVAGTNGGVNQNDALRVRFLSDGGVQNCRGADIGQGSPQPVMGDFELYVSSDGALICHPAGGDRQPIVDGVERFKVRFGVDVDADGSVDRYETNYANLSGELARRIRSVRIQLLLTGSTQEGDQPLPEAIRQRYSFVDGSTIDKTDRTTRVLFDQTVTLLNPSAS